MSTAIIVSRNEAKHSMLLRMLKSKGVDVSVYGSIPAGSPLSNTRYLFIFEPGEEPSIFYQGKTIYVYKELSEKDLDELFPRLFSYSSEKIFKLGNSHEKYAIPSPPKRKAGTEKPKKKKKLNSKNNKKRSLKPKSIKPYLVGGVLLIWLLLSPFIFLFLSAGATYLSLQSVKSQRFTVAKGLLNTSSFLSSLSQNQFQLMSHIPVMETESTIGYDTAVIINTASSLGIKSINLIPDMKDLMSHVISDEQHDMVTLSKDLSLSFDELYKEASFLESEIETININPMVDEQMLSLMGTAREYLYAASVITREIPNTLGADGRKNYLVLLQNSMEVRPTGGFIGSFAIVSFENGKLVNSQVYDVYDADGQIKGYVRPPEPIEKHLGEASWYLRDSNWDPNFTVSARRAIWFLDKSLNIPVDGVIAVNMQVAQSILKVTGPIEIIDFNDTVNYENMYEIVQNEVHKDFFPGSHKKKNYLTALQTSIMGRLQNLQDDEVALLAKTLYQHIEGRDIQIYSSNNDIQNVGAVLGWSGENIDMPTSCGENCMNNWFSIIEANVGVNKANYYINRSAKYSSEVKGGFIRNRVVYKIKNNAPTTLNKYDTRYKNYIRLVTNDNTVVKPVGVLTTSSVETRSADMDTKQNRTEAGLLVDIPAGEEWSIVFEWDTKHDLSLLKNGEVRYYWRKQSGVDGFPIQVRLTYKGEFSYNSTLERDFSKIIDF